MIIKQNPGNHIAMKSIKRKWNRQYFFYSLANLELS